MNSSIKISLYAICSLILAFSILITIDFFQYYQLQNDGKNFSKILDIIGQEKVAQANFFSEPLESNSSKIFLIGSSHIKSLNTTHIQEQLSNNNQDFDIYNLAIGADSPEERFKNLDLLILSEPKIVVYGIAYRDFMIQSFPGQLDNESISPLPDPNFFFNKQIKELFSNYDFDFMENPKLVTLTALKLFENDLKKSLRNETQNLLVYPYPNTFFKESKNDVPLTDIELKNMFFAVGATFNSIGDYNNNVNVISFKKIINKLQENNIEIIIFTTPQSKYYLNAMPSSAKNTFEDLLDHLEKNSKVKIYSLQEKYQDLEIWDDPQHVAIFNNTQIYSKDIAEIILNEIES